MRAHRWAALCLILVLFLVLSPVRLPAAWADGTEEQRLLGLINEYRQVNGAGPLASSEALSASAQRHSEDMAAHDFLSHESKESSYYPDGSDLANRTTREDYPTNAYIAENVARGQLSAEEVFEDWRLSPDHNANMLDKRYTAVGIGRVGSYWTADFGSETGAGTLVPEVRDPTKIEPPDAERMAGEEQRQEKATLPTKPAEDPTTKQYTAGETARSHGQETAPLTPAEPATSEQTSPLQSDADLSAAEQTVEEQSRHEEPTSPTTSGDEAANRITFSSLQPAGSHTVHQYDPAGEQAAGEPVSGTTAQPIPASPDTPRAEEATPVEAESMETALAAREAVPEDAIGQASSAPEEAPGPLPATWLTPAGIPSGASGSVSEDTPVVRTMLKKLPRTNGDPLLLLMGGILVLAGGRMIYGLARNKKGLRAESHPTGARANREREETTRRARRAARNFGRKSRRSGTASRS